MASRGGLWCFHSVREGNHTSCRRQTVRADCRRHATNNFGWSLTCSVNDSPWTTPGKQEASLSSFSALAALRRRKSSMWSQGKRETSHLHCCRKLFPGLWTGIMYHNSRYGWNYGTKPATHGPCDIFFMSRSQILYTVAASQMWKLQDKKHIWVTSWWVTAEPQAHLSSSTDPALECLQNPFFLLCFWMVKAACLAILQGISRKWHAWCLHVFAHETTLICLEKHMLSQKSEEENNITKNSKILFSLEQTISTRLF